MASKIGIVLALDGEREFTQGMKNAQSSAKLLKTNLTQLDAELKGNANSVEALRKKQEALKKLQEGYNRVLTAAKAGQANAKKAYDEQAAALEKLRKKYDDAKKALDQMQKEGKEGTKEYEQQQAAVKKLANDVDRQAANYLKAEGRLSQWDAKVAQAEGDLKKNSAALDQNAQYLDEASKSADGCATSIDRMGDEVEDTTKDLGEGSKGLKDFLMYTAGNLAASAIKAVGDKAKEAAKYVIEVGSRFEASMSKVAALSGASTTELSQMEEMAKQLGSTTIFSASEVADGFSYMALAGWSAQQSLDAMPGILNLAASSGMELATASDMVTDYLSAFGMEASEAGRMADMMAYAQANSNTSTTQLGEAFGNCAANMHAAGQDMATTTSFLEAFANQGIKGSEAGTKLSAIMRDITAKMKDGKIMIGDTAVEVMDANGNFRDMTDIMIDVEAATAGMGTAERSAALAATFTSKSIGGLNMILAEGMDNIAGYEKNLNSADGTATTMANTMQDNLQGKIAGFDSAVEGLGIALYGYFSGPLSGAVELATGFIQGITKAITPQKTELGEFIDSVKSMHNEVDALIKQAETATSSAFVQIAEIDGAVATLEAFDEAYGLFIDSQKEAGTPEIATALSTIATSAGEAERALDGLADTDLDGMATSTETSTERAGSAVTTLAQNIQQSAGVAEEGFEAVGTSAGTAQAGIEGLDGTSLGKLDGTASKSAKGVAKIGGGADGAIKDIERLNDTDLSTFETTIKTTADSVAGVGSGAKTAATDVSEGLDEMRTAFDGAAGAFRINEIIDPFELFQANKAIETLQRNGIDLSKYWNAENGRLDLSNAEFKRLTDERKNAIVQSAIDQAEAASEAALIQAKVQKRAAESAVKGAQDAIDNAARAAGATQTADGTWVIGDPWGANTEFLESGNEGVDKLASDLAEADASLKVANSDMERAQKTADATSDVCDELRKEYTMTGDAASEAGKEAQEAGENTAEGMATAEDGAKTAAEAAEKYAEAVGNMSDRAKSACDSAQKAITDYFTNAKEAAKNAFDINPFEAWEVNQEHGLSAMQTAFDTQIANMQEYSTNLQTVSQYVGTQVTPEFLNYLTGLGEGGAQAMAELAKALSTGDTATVEKLMNSYTEAMDVQDEIANVTAMNALAFALGMGEIGSDTAAWSEVSTNIHEFASGVDTDLTKELGVAIGTAKRMGVKIPDELADVIANGASNPEQAVKDATDIINQAIAGQTAGIEQAAKTAGLTVPDGFSEAIQSGGAEAQAAWSALLGGINTEEAITEAGSAGSEAGAAGAAGFSEGMSEGGGDAAGAASGLVDTAKANAVTTAATFAMAGTASALSFAAGLKLMQFSVDGAAQSLGESAKTKAGSANFAGAGSSAGSAFASGVASMSGYAAGAGNSLASSALNGASGYYYAFQSVGSNMASGLAAGIYAQTASVAQAAANMVTTAIVKAKEAGAIKSPSRKFRDLIGKQIGRGTALGIRQTTDLVADEAEAQMNNTLYALQKWLAKNKAKIQRTGTSMSDAASYGWQQLANQQLNSGFGISRWKKSGSTSTKMSNAEYAKEIYNAAKQYIDNVKVLYNVSLREEQSYWWNVRKHLKSGTQAWYDATERINDLKAEQAQAVAKAQQELVESSRKTLEHQMIIRNVSVKDQIEYWKKVKAQLKKGSDEWFEVTATIKDLQQQAKEDQAAIYSQILSNAEKYVSNRKAQNLMSIKQEEAYWVAIRKKLKAGTDEYNTATQNIIAARAQIGTVDTAQDLMDSYQIYVDMSLRAEMQYWEEIRKHYKKGTTERLQADKAYYAAKTAYADALTELEQEYADNTAEIRQQLADDIAEQEQSLADRLAEIDSKLAEDVAKADEDRLKKIADLQDKYISTVQSRKSQIMSAFDIFGAFESSSATGEELLFNMQAQAAGYRDWAQTLAQLEGRGILGSGLIEELRSKGVADSAAIHALMQLTDAQLQAYNEAYAEREAVALEQAERENTELLAETNASVKTIEEETAAEIERLRADAKAQREEATKSTNAEIKTLNADANKRLADLKASYTAERKEMTAAINSGLLNLAKNIQTIAADETATLINKLTGSTESAARAAATVKASAKNAAGNRSVTDYFAWMDELGIGSEMIVRKDGARLNTNVRPGDAIIPAANTDNLWSWSEVSPQEMISGIRAQQAAMAEYISSVMSGVASMAALNARVLTGGSTAMGGGSDAGDQLMMSMLALMQEYMPYMAERQTLSVDGRELAGATAGYMSSELAMRSRRRR